MILQNVPELNGNEEKYVLDTLRTNWISSQGKYVALFEEKFAELCGVKHGIACSNGTTAIHLAAAALGITAGTEVIVPDFTLVADANMFILAGAKPVLVDVRPGDWCLDPGLVERAITERTKAILAVHMYGHPCDMDVLRKIAASRGIALIEDAAQAHGSKYKGAAAGSLGDLACFSFYASKTLTTGEGGMLLTDDAAIAAELRSLRNHYFPADMSYVHEKFAFNYRLTSLQGAIGLAQCEKAAEKYEKKRRMLGLYREGLKNVKGITMQEFQPGCDPCPWNAVIILEDEYGRSRDDLQRFLKERQIQTRPAFAPLHAQPAYKQKLNPAFPEIGGSFPVSTHLGSRAMCLPSSLGLTEADIGAVCKAVAEAGR